MGADIVISHCAICMKLSLLSESMNHTFLIISIGMLAQRLSSLSGMLSPSSIMSDDT